MGAAALGMLAGCSGTSAAPGGSTQTVNAITGTTTAHADKTKPKPRPKPKPTHPTTTTLGSATVGTVNVPPPPATDSIPPTVAGAVTFVGDSVGVDATPFLQQDVPGIVCNAMVDRSWGEGEVVLQGLASEGALGSVVVIELGLNGPIGVADFQEMMSILHGVKRVVFLNIRLPVGAYGPGTDYWGGATNAILASEVPKYPNAVLADWFDLSNDHADWFAPDGIHLDPPGAAAMAELVKEYV